MNDEAIENASGNGQPPHGPLTRRWILGAGAAGLTLSLLAGTAFAASANSSTTTTTTTSVAAPSTAASGMAPTTHPLAVAGRPAGPHGLGGPKGGPGGGLTVTGINGSTITVKRPDGTAQNITVNGSTTYTVAGTSAQLSDVKAGEQIHATGTVSNGTLTASHVDVVLPHLGGQLTAISGNTLSVTDRSGASKKIVVGSGTTFLRAGATVSLSSLQTGNQIDAAGTLNSDGSLTARVVHVVLPAVDGSVTAVNGSTITVQARGPNAGAKTVTVNGSTTYALGGPSSTTQASLSTVQVGDHIHAEGTLSSSGVLTALVIHLNLPAVDGAVTGVSGNTITVQGRGPQANGTRSVIVGSATTYSAGGPTSTTKAGLSDVKAGVHIHAEGTLNSNGSLNATTVRIDQPPTAAAQ